MSFTENSLGVRLPESVTLEERDLADLEMLLSGAFHPLQGYHVKEEYESVVRSMRLLDDSLWPMPITLGVPKHLCKPQECSEEIPPVQILLLRNQVGTILGKVYVTSIYHPNIDEEIKHVLGTEEDHHPHARFLRDNMTNCYYVGGRVEAQEPIVHFDFQDLRKSPADLKKELQQSDFKNIVGFQTRNPMHRSHFELTKMALKTAEESNGQKTKLLLTPAVGPTQPGDIDYRIRVMCYKKLVSEYPAGTVSLVLLPLAMRMAGPREAVWHAIIRKNYGCTHFIVGRDHAGPSVRRKDGSSFYGPYDAHELLKSVEAELGICPIFGKSMFYVESSESTTKTYISEDDLTPKMKPHNISGTAFREMLEKRDPVPEWYSFPSIIKVLQKHYKPRHELGFCVYFTGLPCSGKSTLATAVEAMINESEDESRRVTLLDADIVRLHLSKGLGFSKEDRSQNVRRIGYVASEIVKHGGICLVANIAPYSEDREFNRNLVESTGGGYVEIYVSTPVEVCESRDVKQLYKKARQGVIKQFTGVSDPYEIPSDCELVVDSSSNLREKVKAVYECLRGQGWVPPV